jgi:RimJ/RimL family protein N-acetyltransferase
MNTQPSLASEILELRPLKTEDFENLYKTASDPLIWEQHPQSDRYKPEVFKIFFKEAIDSKGAMAIVDKKTREIIGTSRFYNFSENESSVVIGYTFMKRDYWGGSFNFELKKLMVNYSLQFVKTCYFHVGLGNKRSQKAMTKLGAVNTGIQEIPISYGPPKKSYVYKIDSWL